MGSPTPQAITPEEEQISKILEDPAAYYKAEYMQALRDAEVEIGDRLAQEAEGRESAGPQPRSTG